MSTFFAPTTLGAWNTVVNKMEQNGPNRGTGQTWSQEKTDINGITAKKLVKKAKS